MKKKLNIKEVDDGIIRTLSDNLRPAVTLGMPDQDTVIAQDSILQSQHSLLQHSISMGQLPVSAGFLGYPVLQDIAQNGLIRACIETVADDMTRVFGTVKLKDNDPEITNIIDEELKEHHIQDVLHEAAEKVGYFGGCLIYIDTGADDVTLQLPLDMSDKSAELGIGKPLSFRVIDPINVYPGAYNSYDPLRKDFYKPEFWFVMGKRVHSSRLIRLVANEVPLLYKPVYNFFGLPQAQILWDYVIHFQECRLAVAEMVNKYSMTVLKTNMKETLLQAGGVNMLDKRMRLIARFRDNNSITAIDSTEEDIVKLETPLSGLTDIPKQALEFLAAVNRTPAVKLLGISPSGFNATGESDIRNYYDHIKSQREKVFRKALKIIIDCIQLNKFGQIDSSMKFIWDELGEADEGAIANVQKIKADTLAVYLDRNILSQEEGRQYLSSNEDSGFAFIDPEELPEDDLDADIDDVDKAGEIF